MPKRVAESIYRGLEPWPRFRLLVEAVARGDHPECRRLVSTSPHGPVPASSPTFLDLVGAWRSLAEAYREPETYFLGWLTALETVATALELPLLRAIEPESLAPRVVRGAQHGAARELAALLAALGRVYEELGLRTEVLRCSPTHHDAGGAAVARTPVPPVEDVQAWRDHLMAAFEREAPSLRARPRPQEPWPS
jgi:hypothetical protein